MLDSLSLIEQVKAGNLSALNSHKWLQLLFLTDEKNVNLEQVESLAEIEDNPVLSYVEKTLEILNQYELPPCEKELVEEVLVWSEVAKCGSREQREDWLRRGFQLRIHNEGSAQIYAHEKMLTPFSERDLKREEFVYTLIFTHGLIGQIIRGEVRQNQLNPLVEWIKVYKDEMKVNISRVLMLLNRCIIEPASPEIWKGVLPEVLNIITSIVNGENEKEMNLKQRLTKLRQLSIEKGEDFDCLYMKWCGNQGLSNMLYSFFRKTDMWYVEAALQDFSFEEFLKIFLLIYQTANPLTIKQISFEPLMKDIYYDYKGKKTTNLYKKRIIEAYLKEMTMEDLMEGKLHKNDHVQINLIHYDSLDTVVGVRFSFSRAGEKLIEFCQEAEKSPVYERSIVLLYDFFGFRKDSFDRLQNEQTYLTDMNNGQDHKKIIAEYATGNVMVDVGSGGGVMLDVLSERHPGAQVIGIDISTNVIEELERKKVREGKGWEVKQADALQLASYFNNEGVDTIVFSSIIHEMFSYIPYKGKKFNPDVVEAALKSAFEILSPGGRIIIRDGIMTEPKDEMRLLDFHDPDGFDFFMRYVKDFKGRKISYEVIDDNNIKLPVNDLMEFLYTYTWGEEAYPHEVQEQFGYLTPSEYKHLIMGTLGEKANILCFKHYLQEGYSNFLLPKVKVMDETGSEVDLPDSTCFIVIEKKTNN